MRTRNLGQSQCFISGLGLGCNNFGWRIDGDQTREVVDAALAGGIFFFDTADVYGNSGKSEEFLGRALGKRRADVVIATKFGHDSMPMGYDPALGAYGGRTYIRFAVEQSLRRLGTDYIDLYQMHSPDTSTPIEETLLALHELVVEGKVRYIGNSQFSADQIRAAGEASKELNVTPFISAQNNFSLLKAEALDELLPTAIEYGLGVLPFFPLASGLLTGKVRRDQAWPTDGRLQDRQASVTAEQLDVIEALSEWGSEHGRTLLELALGVLAMTRPVSSVIAGATSVEQVEANLAAYEWKPSPAEVAELWSLALRT
ncbi:MAG: aldo/keto reductase [Actinomycetes bacterium]